MPQQNFANHGKTPTTLIVTAAGGALGLVSALVGLCMPATTAGTCLIGTGTLVLALSFVYGLIVMRHYAVGLQDRIIRLEMRVRLDSVLSGDLKARAASLTTKQLIGLRFESDANLPALVQKVLDERIEKANDIKKLVKDWQADLERV